MRKRLTTAQLHTGYGHVATVNRAEHFNSLQRTVLDHYRTLYNVESSRYNASRRADGDPNCGRSSELPMAYVERGVVKSKRSIWRLKTITDFFWAIINFIGVFFATMFSMEKSDAYRKGSGSSKKWDGGGPGGPGSGPYGGGGGGPRGPPRGLDNVRGIDHSSLPACGSCCGG